MREILFRGKRLDNGDWVEGYLYEHEPPLVGIVSEKDEPEASKWFIARTGFADWNMPRPVEFVEVSPSTVGQYTGLKGKNGKRIFEGDIVKTSDITHEGVIQISGESFEIAIRKGCWVMVAGEDWDFLETNHECIEVIGNIHDNPELLKGGEGL